LGKKAARIISLIFLASKWNLIWGGGKRGSREGRGFIIISAWYISLGAMTRHHDTKLKKLSHTLAQGVDNQDRTFEKSGQGLI